jgi:large subunit ribosomal protein L17
MRHQKSGRKFGRSSAHRQALTANQVTALLRHGRITTTEAKAKELRRWVDRVITAAKDNDVAARRNVSKWVTEREVSNKLFGTYVPRYASRPGGFTRVLHLGPRHGDGAEMAIIEMVGEAQ